jgi:hypothetical protein
MKYIIAAFASLLLSFSSSAQDSCNLNYEKDKFADVETISTKSTDIITIPQVFIHSEKTQGVTSMVFGMFESGSAYCFDENSTVVFLFSDGSKFTGTAKNELNCGGTVIVAFKNNDANLLSLQIKKLTDIRFNGNGHQTDVAIPEDKAKQIALFLRCLAK